MLRFFSGKLNESNDMDITVISENIVIGQGMWKDGRKYFKQYISYDAADIQLLPVVNKRQEVVCYAYQDNEANRELRMIKELEKNNRAFQFKDVFPDIRDVIVCGCNELAYCFVKYLEKQKISVKTVGKYWNYFGYNELVNFNVEDEHTLVVYAENIIPKTGSLYQTIIRSISPEFECIDKIYEANVLGGNVKDAKGSIKDLLEKLNGKEVVILGTDVSAQDAYDFLYENGIDICCFSEWKCKEKRNIHRTLLGKKIVSVEEVINSKADSIFIDTSNKNSALGIADEENFDYYGYVRNEQFFMLKDYTELSCTNLIHVLKGKRVLFAGDKLLCAMVSDYIKEKEQGDIELEFVEVTQCITMKEQDIFCVVNPWFDLSYMCMDDNPQVWYFWETLSKIDTVFYTDYFSQTRILVNIDLYRNREKEKYSIKKLCPKGILLGRIPSFSGNVFFRGILDGHPNILKWGYNHLNNNLLLYCIRLAGEKAEDILMTFGRMYRGEFAFRLEEEISCWDTFEKSLKELLALKESFTSQELFVIFHIAYSEMQYGYKITDLDQKIIYWEPHMFPREEFPFLVQWLDDEQIHGQTVFMHRDMIIKNGSLNNCRYKFYRDEKKPELYIEEIVSDDITYQHWEEFHVRFEDIKLHPQRELRKICDRIGVPWADTMLHVTDNGQIWGYYGTYDFDIKPVFNKYEEFLSEFDRFRISLINSPYQKKYGYTYEDCMKFLRKELQEMFLKEFRFQSDLRFKCEKDRKAYFLRINKALMVQLWKVRKHALMDDIVPEFDEVEIGESITKKQKRADIAGPEEFDRILKFVKEQEQLVLYGTGKDCEGLLTHLDENEQLKLIFSDLKAEYTDKTFHSRKVVAPSELCGKYKDYNILITSSQFYRSMQQRLEDMGVEKDRITCNRFQLWE